MIKRHGVTRGDEDLESWGFSQKEDDGTLYPLVAEIRTINPRLILVVLERRDQEVPPP
jgi:hypothetical protein